MAFGVAELVIICIAVAGVGMYSHRSTAQDLATVLNPIFWGLIVGVAAVLYAGYLAAAFVVGLLPAEWRKWGVLALVLAGLAAWPAVAYVRSRNSAEGRARWRRGMVQAVELVPTLAVLLFGLPLAGILVAGYTGGNSLVYAAGAGVGAWAGVVAFRAWRGRAADGGARAAFTPLLTRWGVRFDENVYPHRINVTTQRQAVPLDLELAYTPREDDSVWISVKIDLRNAAEREFSLSVPVSWQRDARPSAGALDCNASGPAPSRDGPLATGVKALALGLFTEGDHSRVAVSTWERDGERWRLRVEASGALPKREVVDFVDRALDLAPLAAAEAGGGSRDAA